MKAKVLSQTTDEIGVKVVASILPGPFVKWYRHPIWWWKMRFLREDIRHLESSSPLSAQITTQLQRREDEVFLYGKDSAR